MPYLRCRSWLVGGLASVLAACGSDNPAIDSALPDAAVIVDAFSPDAPSVDAFMFDAPDAPPAPIPVFRHVVDLGDEPLAREALRILGAPAAGGTRYCNECHGLTRQNLRYWRALSDAARTDCLADTVIESDADAVRIVACLRSDSEFTPRRVGAFSTAGRLDWFRYVFEHGAGENWEAEYEEFVARVAMPIAGRPEMSQEDFDVVAEWFIRGIPAVDAVLPTDPRPTECLPAISSDAVAHVEALRTNNWGTINEDAAILMHGCAGAATPASCLSGYELASETEYGADWDLVPGTKLRVLHTTSYASAYWTRSSADGRFVGHGGGPGGATIIDLARNFEIPTSAFYDPGFMPDNSGFMFHRGGAAICEQSLLTSEPTRVTFTEPECNNNTSIGLYQHVGASLAGGDYWAVSGAFVSDSGGHRTTLGDPAAGFSEDSSLRFTMMVNAGGGFVTGATGDVATPFEGDTVISPSGKLIITRVAGEGDEQLGFVLRSVDATRVGRSGLDISAPEIARYCLNGGKPGFSFDERYFVIHHYISDNDDDARELGFEDASDPGFADYRAQGAANVFLVEIATGVTTRITNMQPGDYALFPHFRSDGWIYFTVRRPATPDVEHIIASDAAFVIGAE